MMKTNEMPNLLLFEDDPLMRMMWDRMREKDELTSLHVFHSWEDFLARGTSEHLKDAVAFVGFWYDKADSKFNGIQMAEMLRDRGVSKIFGISFVPSYFDGAEHLFTAILEGNLPNVRKLLGLEKPLPPPIKLVPSQSKRFIRPPEVDSRGWVTQ
jgi:hypothetical protein